MSYQRNHVQRHVMRRLALAAVIAVLLATPLAALTVHLIPEAVQGTQTGTQHVNAGAPGPVTLTLVSSVWKTETGHTITATIDRSFNGGSTWEPVASMSVTSPAVNSKSGGLPDLVVHFDGVASDYRFSVVPNAPFSWGVDASF